MTMSTFQFVTLRLLVSLTVPLVNLIMDAAPQCSLGPTMLSLQQVVYTIRPQTHGEETTMSFGGETVIALELE